MCKDVQSACHAIGMMRDGYTVHVHVMQWGKGPTCTCACTYARHASGVRGGVSFTCVSTEQLVALLIPRDPERELINQTVESHLWCQGEWERSVELWCQGEWERSVERVVPGGVGEERGRSVGGAWERGREGDEGGGEREGDEKGTRGEVHLTQLTS